MNNDDFRRKKWLKTYEETKPSNDSTPFFHLLKMADGSMVVVEDDGAIWNPGGRLLGVHYNACYDIYITSDIETGLEICCDKECPYGDPDIAFDRTMASLIFGVEINTKENAELKKRCVHLMKLAYDEAPEVKKQVFG